MKKKLKIQYMHDMLYNNNIMHFIYSQLFTG